MFEVTGCWFEEQGNYHEKDLQKVAGSNIILMQFTGLLDKNGVEIFEDDILGGVFEPGYVGWCDKCCSFEVMLRGINGYGPCQQCEGDVQWLEVAYDEYKNLEVIGNIHQHPHLLEKTND